MQLRQVANDVQLSAFNTVTVLYCSLRREKLPHSIFALLPREQSRAMLLHISGLTYKQIAVITDVTYPVALKRLTDGYATFRKHLGP